MKRIRKCATAGNLVNASSTDANRQLTFQFAVDQIRVSVLPASGTPQAVVAINIANANTGAGSFAAPVQNDLVASFAPGVDQVHTFDLHVPTNVFKVTTVNGAAANVTVYVVGIASADA